MTSFITSKRILIVGDGAVGKTALIRKLLNRGFDPMYKDTLETTVCRFGTNLIYDTAGQCKCSSIYDRQYDMCIIMYDTTHNMSFKNVGFWKNKIRNLRQDIPILIVGNKIDCGDRKVFTDRSTNISSKTGENVQELVSLINQV